MPLQNFTGNGIHVRRVGLFLQRFAVQLLHWYVYFNFWKSWFSCLLKSRFFKNHELYWSNLPQNSNFGQELVQKSGVQIPVGEGQIFLSCFLFIFIFSIKNWILTHKIFFYIFFWNINKNRYIEQILFHIYVTI